MDWSTKDFLKEIDGVAQLYALSSCSSMASSMIASLGKKSLMQHVDGSKLPEEQLELQKTLGQVASSNGQQSVANKLVKEPKGMPNVPAYLTQADWDVLLQGDLDKAPHVLVALPTLKPEPPTLLATVEKALSLTVAAGWGDHMEPKSTGLCTTVVPMQPMECFLHAGT